jgi:hypothetical protein
MTSNDLRQRPSPSTASACRSRPRLRPRPRLPPFTPPPPRPHPALTRSRCLSYSSRPRTTRSSSAPMGCGTCGSRAKLAVLVAAEPATCGSGRPRARARRPSGLQSRATEPRGLCSAATEPLSEAPPKALVSLASGHPGARRRAHRPLLLPHRQIARHDRQAAARRGTRPWRHRQRDRRRRLPARPCLSAVDTQCGGYMTHRLILYVWL